MKIELPVALGRTANVELTTEYSPKLSDLADLFYRVIIGDTADEIFLRVVNEEYLKEIYSAIELIISGDKSFTLCIDSERIEVVARSHAIDNVDADLVLTCLTMYPPIAFKKFIEFIEERVGISIYTKLINEMILSMLRVKESIEDIMEDNLDSEEDVEDNKEGDVGRKFRWKSA